MSTRAPLDNFNRTLALTAISTARSRGRRHIAIRPKREGKQERAAEIDQTRDPGNELDRRVNQVLTRFPGEREMEVIGADRHSRTDDPEAQGSSAHDYPDSFGSFEDPGSYGVFDASDDFNDANIDDGDVPGIAGIDGGYPA